MGVMVKNKVARFYGPRCTIACPNFSDHQSAYRPRHTTETSLLASLNTTYHASDSGSSTLLVSLDLSAAVDIIDHHILISRLCTSFGDTVHVPHIY